MRYHTEARTKPTASGYPWFCVKAGATIYHLRIPGIASASSLAAYYSGVVVATQGAAKAAQDIASTIEDGETLAKAQAASEAVLSAQHEMYGALGFVVLSCWRDPHHELVAQSAWLQSYGIRRAMQDGASLEAFDSELVAVVKEAQRLMALHTTDLKTAFGLVAWDELVEAGLTHEGIQTIGTECARLVFESIKSKGGSGVEIIADF